RRDLLAGVVDELVVDPDVGQRAAERPGRRPDGQAEQRDEEDQAEEEAPERTAEGARAPQAVELARPRLLLALRPRDDRAVLDLDRLLLLEVPELLERGLGPVRGREAPHGQRRHRSSLARCRVAARRAASRIVSAPEWPPERAREGRPGRRRARARGLRPARRVPHDHRRAADRTDPLAHLDLPAAPRLAGVAARRPAPGARAGAALGP